MWEKKLFDQCGNKKKCFATKIFSVYLYALQMITVTCIYLLLCQGDVWALKE